MKKVLLDSQIGFYKAQLHAHTIVSDGENTPEKVKEIYKELGYSVVAFTDHDVLCSHYDLKDDDFLPITSYEADINETMPFGPKFKAYHFNLYAKDPTNTISPVFCKDKCWLDHMLNYVSDEQLKINFEVPFSVEGANKMIKAANDAGFFVSLNHPVSWSILKHDDYIDLKGLWGVEVYNHGSYIEGREDSPRVFDEFLENGTNLFPLCADDSHFSNECGGSFTMIQAQKLEYGEIIKALLNGDFYSSYGPEIYHLSVDEEFIYITTSNARNIFVTSDIRVYSRFNKNNSLFTEAKISLKKYIANKCKYFKIVVVDDIGRRAYTRAYYLKDIFENENTK